MLDGNAGMILESAYKEHEQKRSSGRYPSWVFAGGFFFERCNNSVDN